MKFWRSVLIPTGRISSLRPTRSAGGETSVDHYMNLIDDEGKVKHGHSHASMDQIGNGGVHHQSAPVGGLGFNPAPPTTAASWTAQHNGTYGSQGDYGRIPPVSAPSYPLSAQGYSNSISSYHLNANPAYYNGGVNQFKQQPVLSSHDQRVTQQLPYGHQAYTGHNGASMLDHHSKRADYGNGHTSTANATAISSPDDGVGSVDNGLIAHHRTSDSQYLSDISRLTSPTLKRSALAGGNAYHLKEDA